MKLTQKLLNKIPEKNWIDFVKNKYNNTCDGVINFYIGDEADNGFLEFETYCDGFEFNLIYCDVTEEEFILIQNGTYEETYNKNKREKIEAVLLEAIYISRWTENNEGLYAVLTPEETEQVIKNIFIELDKNGYEINKK